MKQMPVYTKEQPQNLQTHPPVITLDGPTGSGKGTIGKLLAEKLGWHFLDSGILYRVLAFAALCKNIATTDCVALEDLAHNLNVKFINEAGKPQQVIYEGENITTAIRQEECGNYASQIAILSAVRNALFPCFQRLRSYPGLIADGRDMGTVVFPDADLKIFLTATKEERARRRWQQLQNKGMSVSLHDVLVDLCARDKRDAERAVAPLKPAHDAKIIDTTTMNVDKVLQEILQLLVK
jgi:CMP/dCMP kinase